MIQNVRPNQLRDFDDAAARAVVGHQRTMP
jgi:hypothetical protein